MFCKFLVSLMKTDACPVLHGHIQHTSVPASQDNHSRCTEILTGDFYLKYCNCCIAIQSQQTYTNVFPHTLLPSKACRDGSNYLKKTGGK